MYNELLLLREQVQLPQYLDTLFVEEMGQFPLIQQICFNTVARKMFRQLRY